MQFSRVLLSVAAGLATAQAGAGRILRLAMFNSKPGSPVAGTNACGLDTVDDYATYYTVNSSTPSCTPLANAADDARRFYSWTNSTTSKCFKAGCNRKCELCRVIQGPDCPTAAPTAPPTHHGSGSGHGSTTTSKPNAIDQALSDEVLECGGSVTGASVLGGASYLGNDSPDTLLTLRVAEAGPVHLDSCTSSFSTILRVYDLKGGDVATCKSCGDCAVELQAGDYALHIEGDDNATLTAGAFDVAMTCGADRGVRRQSNETVVVNPNECYTSYGSDQGVTAKNWTAFFLFEQASDSVMDHGVCIMELPSARKTANSILLTFLGVGGCGVNIAGDSTVRATVIDDDDKCVREIAVDNMYYQVGRTAQGGFDVKLGCLNDNCTKCKSVNASLPGNAGTCLDSKYKVYDASNINTCVPRPAPNSGSSGGGSPVGAILGSVFGALALGGVIFFVLQRRKLGRTNAYAPLLQSNR